MMLKVLTFLAYLLSHGQGDPTMASSHLVLKSAAFDNMGQIPTQYTCKGVDESVPLHWKGVPRATKSLVLVMDDPDAPGGLWYHWGYYNMLPQQTRLSANIHVPPYGADPVRNSWGVPEYQGPCPPSGHHRYEFKIFALDKRIKEAANVKMPRIQKDMKGHVLAMAKLTGIF
jgi:Raf kinase inhibitor-like YbhB/YbcL family protein